MPVERFDTAGWSDLQRLVAVKCIRSTHADNEAFIRFFRTVENADPLEDLLLRDSSPGL
jgi:hypothetical protein